MDELTRSLAWFRPEIALTAGLLLVVLADSFLGKGRDLVTRLLTVAALAAAFGFALQLQAGAVKASLFSGMLVIDPLNVAFKLVLIAAGLLTVLAFSFRNSRELHGLGHGELFALVLALVLSCLLLASANDIVMLYLALEMVSITSYVMVAYLKGDRMSNEASLKYVLFGAASTGSMLYGFSLLYGLAGTTAMPGDPGVPRGRHPRREPLRRLRRHAAGARRVRLQDRGGALPLLVPGRLPGRAHAGHGAALGAARRPRASRSRCASSTARSRSPRPGPGTSSARSTGPRC